MITEHIDPMDNRKLSQEDAEFLRLVHLVLGVHVCRDCGSEIVDRSPKATLCSGCAEDRYRKYRREYEKAAWQRTKSNKAASLNGTAA